LVKKWLLFEKILTSNSSLYTKKGRKCIRKRILGVTRNKIYAQTIHLKQGELAEIELKENQKAF
jgi:hypothetical protein